MIIFHEQAFAFTSRFPEHLDQATFAIAAIDQGELVGGHAEIAGELGEDAMRSHRAADDHDAGISESFRVGKKLLDEGATIILSEPVPLRRAAYLLFCGQSFRDDPIGHGTGGPGMNSHALR